MTKRQREGTEKDFRARDLWKDLPSRATLRDVTLRDGLQSEKIIPKLREKVSLIRKILGSGIRELEITAFVHPQRVPPMADADLLWRAVSRDGEGVYSALVFNRKGLERAMNAGVGQVAVIVSASEAHSKSNTGCTISEALREAVAVLSEAKSSGMEVRAGVASAFGCNLEGDVPLNRVLTVAETLFEAGPLEMTLADTSGTGNSARVAERVSACKELFGRCRLSLHLHNANGWAFANLLAGLQLGVETFDVTVGGLGGCPFMPHAAGNLPAQHVIRFLDTLGVETGITPSPLLDAQKMLEKILGRKLIPPLAGMRCAKGFE